jgi:predicted nucleic acid-binding protein
MTLRFIDTNILIYAVSANPADKLKRETAISLLQQPDLALSIQVLQEFYVQAIRPTRLKPLSHEQAVSMITSLSRFPIQDNTRAILQVALEIKGKWPLSLWDANIIAAAKALGCTEVLSEDMQKGQLIDGVRVVNPFV